MLASAAKSDGRTVAGFLRQMIEMGCAAALAAKVHLDARRKPVRRSAPGRTH